MSKLDINLVRRLPVLLARQGRSLELLTSTSLTSPPIGTPPTDIALSASSVLESAVPGTVIATISANGDSPWSFAKLNDPDSKFRVEGSNLILDQPIDFETDTEHAVRIRATNASGSHNKDFTISVLDVAEAVAPTVVDLSSTSVFENAGIGAQIATISSNGTAPVTYSIENDPDGKFAINGNALELAATLDFETDTEHPVTIRATNAAGFHNEIITINVNDVVENAPTVSFGISDPDALVGPNGDEAQFLTPRGFDLAPSGPGVSRYVDPDVVSSGDGLTPATALKTWQEAKNARTEGDLILLKAGGVFPEVCKIADFNDVRATAANPIKIAKWGAGPAPEITAGDAPGGWTVCPDPATALGNVNFASIYYVDIVASDDVPDMIDAVLLENGQVGSMSMLGEATTDTDSMLIPQHKSVWWNGDNAGSSIADLTKSAETGTITATSAEWQNYAQGSLDGATVMLNGTNNTYIAAPLTSHNAATGELVFTSGSPTNWSTKEIALRNLPALISTAGQWAARNLGGSNWRIYYWPRNAANIEDVRISQRKGCIDLDAAEHVYFYGLKFTGAGGPWPSDGRGATAVYSTQQNIYQRENIGFEQCHAIGNNVGGINVSNIKGARLYDNTAEITLIGRGFTLDRCENLVFLGNNSQMTGFTSVSQYGLLNALIANNRFGEVRSVHGNGSSLYLRAKNVWLHGNLYDVMFVISQTMQDSGNLYFTCNVVKLGPGAAMRGIEDNSDYPAGIIRSGPDYSEVLTLFPTPAQISKIANTFLLWDGADGSEVTTALQYANTTHANHTVAGNVAFGSITRRDGVDNDPSGPYVATVTPDENNNVLVGTGGAGNPILSNGQSNIQVADPAAVWVDPLNDPTPVEFGPADASCGDQTVHLPLTESWLTNLPDALAIVNKDYLGNDILWSNAPRGAVRGPSVSTVPTAATNILLTKESVPENATIGTVVAAIAHNGTLPATLSITADPDNKFAISGTELVTTATFDLGVKTSHSVTIRVDNTAAGGGVYSKSFSIAVSAPVAWLPSALAELAIWIDPSDLSTMRQERTGASAITPVAVGEPVGTIRDKSANGYYFVAPSDAARPILRQAGALYYLEFRKANSSRLQLTAAAMTSIAQPNFIGMTADMIENGAGRFFDGGSGTVRHILAATGTTELYLHAGSWAGPFTTRTPGTPQAVTTLWDGANSYIRLDAGAEQAGSVGSYPLQGFYIGGEYNGSNPSDMNLFSLVVNDGDLTSGERDNLDAYLASKGGI